MEHAVGIIPMAEILGVSPSTIRRLAQASGIPAFMVGGVYRFFPSKVVEHLSDIPDPWARTSRARNARKLAA